MVNRRVIVTSSRSWDDKGIIRAALDDAYARLGPFTLAYSGCHGGGEKIAHQLANGSLPVQRYPPYEFTPGATAAAKQAAIAAGNQAMVDDGSDLCLAFIGPCVSSHCLYLGVHPSHGVTGCCRLAERAMIPVRRFWTPWLREWALQASAAV